MYLEQFFIDGLGCASYLVGCEGAGVAAVVDPDRDVRKYLTAAAARGLTITHIIETHLHADHVSGNVELQARTGADIYVHEGAGAEFEHKPLREGDAIELGNVRLTVRHTPGHTPESITLLVTDLTRAREPWMALTGDTLFVGDIGRPDLVGLDAARGLASQMYDTIQEELLPLPDGVMVFPGHGAGSLCGKSIGAVRSTTIGFERHNNPALSPREREAFVAFAVAELPEQPANVRRIKAQNRRGPRPLGEVTPRPLTIQTAIGYFQSGAALLDLRDKASFKANHIPGAVHLELDDQLSNRIGFVLPPDVPVILLLPESDEADDYAHAVYALARVGYDSVVGYLAESLTPEALQNAMVTHAAFGGSTNLLLHIPAIAHAANLPRPKSDDWARINRQTPRLVDVMPNGPVGYGTVQVFLAGGVPEVMLHLRDLGLLHLEARTVNGTTLGESLDTWERSERRHILRERLKELDGVNPDDVIMTPARARERGVTSTITFLTGNLAPQGAVIKSTSIDPSVVDPDGVYRKTGPARVFTSERAAIAAVKGLSNQPVKPGDVIILIGCGPLGTGMEETYQLTSALRYLPHGKTIALITDARFSGVSTGACAGHVGPEALAGGPIGRVRDGDSIRIRVDRVNLVGEIDLVGEGKRSFDSSEGAHILAARPPHPGLLPSPDLPDDTRLWAALQNVSGGTWGGCVYDVEMILERLRAK